MAKEPIGRIVRCPRCNAKAMAIVPKNSHIVRCEENSDGKVGVNCMDCGEKFVAYFRTDT